MRSRWTLVLAGSLGAAAVAPTPAHAYPHYKFLRGDANADGSVNLTDAIEILNWLYQGGSEPACMEAADADDSQAVNLTDAVVLLNWMFQGGPVPPAPSPDGDPDFDPNPGSSLGCEAGQVFEVQPRPFGEGDLALGDRFSCAIVPDAAPGADAAVTGPVFCWGANDVGQLGVGDFVGRARPARLDATGFIATKVAAGASSACAIEAGTGEVRCWGRGVEGQLGRGEEISKPRPGAPLLDFSEGSPALDLAVGGRHACAIRSGGGQNQVLCWGDNEFGQLGFESGAGPQLPGVVDLGGANPLLVAAGNNHTCVATDDAKILCWGDNTFFQLDDRDLWFPNYDPVEVFAIDHEYETVLLEAGHSHTCAVNITGERTCWGEIGRQEGTEQLVTGIANGGVDPDGFGPLSYACYVDVYGNHDCDMFPDERIDQALELPDGIRTLALGASHGCATYDAPVTCPGDEQTSTVCCFGDNDDGQLGNNLRPQPSEAPVAVDF